VIAGNKIYKCEDPDGYAFAVASSSMFIAWQKGIGGRLKSDPNFSNTLVWNNLPLPPVDDAQRHFNEDVVDVNRGLAAAYRRLVEAGRPVVVPGPGGVAVDGLSPWDQRWARPSQQRF